MQTVVGSGPDFSVSWESLDVRTAVLRLDGELELHTARRFREKAVELYAQGVRRIVIDLSRVSFIDSAGLSEIIWLFRRFRNAAPVSLVDSTARHRRTLDQVRLSSYIPVHPSVEAAVREMPV